MHAPVRGSLFVVLLACLLAPTFIASGGYVPTPIVEVGKPRLEDIAYSPDGRVLATLTTDWIELLDADTFEPVARFGRGGDEIEFSSDASEIAVFDGAEPARIYDAVTGTLKDEIPVGRFAHALSPDWRRLAYADGDTVYVWDRDAQAVTATLSGDPERNLLQIYTPNGTTAAGAQRVRYLAFHPDGVGLLVVSYRRTVGLWDSFSGELMRHYNVGRTWVRAPAIRHDGTEFAAFTQNMENLVWRFDDPEPTTVRADPTLGAMYAFAYDPAGGLWLTGADSLHRLNPDDGTISTARTHLGARVHPADSLFPESPTFDVSRGRVATKIEDRIALWSIEAVRLERLVDHAWGVGKINAAMAVYVPGHDRLVTFGRATRRWDDTSGDVFRTQELPTDPGVVAATSDGSVVALQILHELRVYQTVTGRLLATIRRQHGWRIAISRDGRRLAVWHGRTTIWSATSGQRLATLRTGTPQADGLAFTPSGRRLVVRTERPERLEVWDIAEGKLVMTDPDGGPFAATPDGILHVARPGAERFEVRKIGADAPLSIIPPPGTHFVGGSHQARLDPSGRYVAIRDNAPTTGEPAMRFFSAASGELLATRVGFSDIRFIAGGDYLFTKGPNDGLALYRTEDFLGIPSDEVAPRNRALTAWGGVKRSQLLPNYPNPFNPETWIPFDLAASGPVHISIYDASGAAVRKLALGHTEAGPHRTRGQAARWDSRDDGGEPVASGVYTYRVTGPGLSDSGRMLLAK